MIYLRYLHLNTAHFPSSVHPSIHPFIRDSSINLISPTSHFSQSLPPSIHIHPQSIPPSIHNPSIHPSIHPQSPHHPSPDHTPPPTVIPTPPVNNSRDHSQGVSSPALTRVQNTPTAPTGEQISVPGQTRQGDSCTVLCVNSWRLRIRLIGGGF